MTTPANPNSPPPASPPGGGNDGNDDVPVFTARELAAAREQAAAEARRHFESRAARTPAPQPGNLNESLAQLVQLQVAQAIGALKPPSGPPAAQPPGSPPGRVVADNTPIYEMPQDDQRALAKRLGPFEFKKRLLTELRDSGARFRLRR